MIDIQNIAPYIAIITAIIAAYYAYRNQMRLKSFELLHAQRQVVLSDMESFLRTLYEVRNESKNESTSEQTQRYVNEYWHEGLILFHKTKGGNFGELVEVMANTLYKIINEPAMSKEPLTEEKFQEWVTRTMNTVASMYGFAHSQMSRELEEMAFSPLQRRIRKHKNKVKSEKAEQANK